MKYKINFSKFILKHKNVKKYSSSSYKLQSEEKINQNFNQRKWTKDIMSGILNGHRASLSRAITLGIHRYR